VGYCAAYHLADAFRSAARERPAPTLAVEAGLVHLGARKRLPATESIRLSQHPAGAPLKPEFTNGFIYSDCWVDDARLVVLNARDAANHGAHVETRCSVTRLERKDGLWHIDAGDRAFRAHAIANAAGPSVLQVLSHSPDKADFAMRLVRGSHIVVPKLFDHPYPYFFQLPDGRIFFAIPYEHDFTLIGTTDADHKRGLDHIEASADEIAYLCEGASHFFRTPVRPEDVVWSYSGVRPLVDDGSGKPEAATRGYRLDLSDAEDGAPILNIFGGKITTYRHLAEEAVDLLATRLPLPANRHWTATKALPGGGFDVDATAAERQKLQDRYPFLEPDWVDRLFKCYGLDSYAIFGDAKALSDCGQHFGHGLTEREVEHLTGKEWARASEDILWRRTKLGLRMNQQEQLQLENYLRKAVAA
jgi:glycerol-3-phosphate dehydrogenase